MGKPTTAREFDTEELARAFIEGVEYVNDSDLRVELAGYVTVPVGSSSLNKRWLVNIYDASGDADNDVSMKSRMLWPSALTSRSRRTATVMHSAPKGSVTLWLLMSMI